MMLHQLGNKSNNVKVNNSRSNDLFAPTPKTTYKIINKQTRIIDDCIRSFDFEVNLDELSSESEIPTGATFIKGDRNTSILNARILKNGLPVDLSGITVTANVKESRTKTTIPAEVVDVNGIVQINLPVSIVDESGVNTFELVFLSGEKVVVSRTYSYKVLASLGEGSLGTNTEKTVLQTLIEQVRESKETSDTIIEDFRNTSETIVEELEVTQADIDDVIAMVGDL